MSGLDQNDRDKLFKILDEQTAKLEKLERGMYGDRENKVKGVIDRLEDIEGWIMRSKLKIAAGIGAWTVLVLLAKYMWEYFKIKKP